MLDRTPARRNRKRAVLALAATMVLVAGALAIWPTLGSTSSPHHLQTFRVTLAPNWVDVNDDPASNYQAVWLYSQSPTTPHRPPGGSGGPKQRYLLLDPRARDRDGVAGRDEWWFVIERLWPKDYPADNHGSWGRQVDFHNVPGDAGPPGSGGIGWGFGDMVSSLALDWLSGARSPSIGVQPAGLNLPLPVPARDVWHTYVIRFVAGRTDGSTVRPGSLTVWVDGRTRPSIVRKNINTVHRAVGPDGNAYVQTWMQIWDGDYTRGLPVMSRVELTLTRVGRTLQEALDDRPTRVGDNLRGQRYSGAGENLGSPSIARIGSRSARETRVPAGITGR